MTVYEKLILARIKFQSANIKKTGENKYAGYTYYELADILPFINALSNELNFICVVSFNGDLAKLDFINTEKPEEVITFTSPMSEANLKGCHAVQNLGAVETYIKRYLYQNCFEIVEADVLDGTMNPTEKKIIESPEITEIKKAIKSGLLKGDLAKKAEYYINNNDNEGIKKVMNYLIENT
ncbi:MAG: ERF family protein [Treponema sp.]|nr:ERF family protein [Treponema sp.]